MSPLEIARELVIAAGCGVAASRIERGVNPPGPNDADDQELDYEVLDTAIGMYAQARIAELEGLEMGG